MNRWRRLWLIVKLLAAVAACVAAAVQAFFYMMESADAVQIHPLSIVVVGLIFGFITYGVLSLMERGVRGRIAPRERVAAQPQSELEIDADFPSQQPLSVPTDDSAQQKSQ